MAEIEQVWVLLVSTPQDEAPPTEAVFRAPAGVDLSQLRAQWVWANGRHCIAARSGNSPAWGLGKSFVPNKEQWAALRDPVLGPALLCSEWDDLYPTWGSNGFHWLYAVGYLEGDETLAFLKWLRDRPGMVQVLHHDLVIGAEPSDQHRRNG